MKTDNDSGFAKGSPEGAGKAFPPGIGDGVQAPPVGSFIAEGYGKDGTTCPDSRLEKSGPKGKDPVSAGCRPFGKDRHGVIVFKGLLHLV